MKYYKNNVCFTWDDNFTRHYSLIAPLFDRYGFKCSFYINSNDESLNETMALNYSNLYKRGFEIGSHGSKHINMLKLGNQKFRDSLKISQKEFQEKIGCTPKTFAFPYHKFNENLVCIAKEVFIETRNTLPNSVRIGLKQSTSSSYLLEKIDELSNSDNTLIISGHSVVTKEEAFLELEEGYEPFVYEELEILLSELSKQSIDVQPFSSITDKLSK